MPQPQSLSKWVFPSQLIPSPNMNLNQKGKTLFRIGNEKEARAKDNKGG